MTKVLKKFKDSFPPELERISEIKEKKTIKLDTPKVLKSKSEIDSKVAYVGASEPNDKMGSALQNGVA